MTAPEPPRRFIGGTPAEAGPQEERVAQPVISPDVAAVPAVGTVRFGIILILLLVAGCVAWAASVGLSGPLHVPGRVEALRPPLRLSHPEGGAVLAVAVREGDRVTSGQVLLRLDPANLAAERGAVLRALSAARLKRARLAAERAGAPRLILGSDAAPSDLARTESEVFEAWHRERTIARKVADARLRALDSRIHGLAMQRRSAATQLALVEDDLAVQSELLVKGLTHAARVRALEREAERLRAVDGELASAEQEARAGRDEAVLEARRSEAAADAAHLEDLRRTVIEERELSARADALSARIAALDLRAPLPGVVRNLSVSGPASVVLPGAPILELIPDDSALVVVADVPVTLISTVRDGQSVVLKPAGHLRGSAEITGRVRRIAPSAAGAPDAPAFFRVEIEPDRRPDGKSPLGGLRLGVPVDVALLNPPRPLLADLLQPLGLWSPPGDHHP